MSDPAGQDKPQIEIVSDEDWKDQVKSADAKLDAEFAGKSASAESQAGEAQPMPAASFSTLVQMFSTQAIVAMGLIPLPDGKVNRQLPLAKHFIDLLGVLEEKSKGNLSTEENRLLENTLHELRMTYIEVSKAKPNSE